jgi:hypothetical protein
MEYLFSKVEHDHYGNVIIPSEYYKRWLRQMHTKYKDLPKNEKESDRKEAQRIIELLEQGDI